MIISYDETDLTVYCYVDFKNNWTRFWNDCESSEGVGSKDDDWFLFNGFYHLSTIFCEEL